LNFDNIDKKVDSTMGNLVGKVALVTGGSRGIGRAICIALAKNGAKVFVNYSSSSAAADETVRLCKEAGSEAEAIGFDVGSSGAVDQAIDLIKEKAGRLDILVNNAGISIDGLFVRLKDEDWDKTLAVNLNGAFYCSRAAGKIMMKARSGRIINVSSVVGEMGNAGQVPYVSSKAGLIGMTKAIAKELASRNVTVNAITPGFIETDMTGSLGENMRETMLAGIPLGRIGKPEEVANLVAFLAADEASYITGQVIGINGGLYM
jgi:3-oxoacyl-[acyl-carrier protein] reductase